MSKLKGENRNPLLTVVGKVHDYDLIQFKFLQGLFEVFLTCALPHKTRQLFVWVNEQHPLNYFLFSTFVYTFQSVISSQQLVSDNALITMSKKTS